MTTLNELKQQVGRFNQLPSRNFLEREEIRIRLLKEVGAYFQRLFAETSGLLTAELMQEVDAVYDVRGIPSVIAKALGVHVNYFHGALAKERSVPCAGGCLCDDNYKTLLGILMLTIPSVGLLKMTN